MVEGTAQLHRRTAFRRLVVLAAVFAVSAPAPAHARSAADPDGEAAAAEYAIRSAVVRIDRKIRWVYVYFRMNRSLPFGPEVDDSSSSPRVQARVVVAKKPSDAARGVMRMGKLSRYCYNDEHDHDALPRVLRRARIGDRLPIAVFVGGTRVSGSATVISERGSPRERLRCGRR